MTTDEWGPWVEVEKPRPWSVFFRYYEMRRPDGSSIRCKRENRLDRAFDWLCSKLT